MPAIEYKLSRKVYSSLMQVIYELSEKTFPHLIGRRMFIKRMSTDQSSWKKGNGNADFSGNSTLPIVF
jgi:hypothetical protein